MTQPMNQPMTPADVVPQRFARHPLSIGHLVMGLVFLGLVGIWALVQADAVAGDDIRWLLPVPWVLAGIAGLLATTLSGRSRGRDAAGTTATMTGWAAPDADHDPIHEPDQPTDPEETR